MIYNNHKTYQLVWICVLLAALFIPASSFSQIGQRLIKVRVCKDEPILAMRFTGKYTLTDQETGSGYGLKTNTRYTVRIKKGRISIGGRRFRSGLAITAQNSKSSFEVNNKRYRGSVILTFNERGLSAINELDIEQYLYGVVPKEVVASWPEEALKAQAVISRTYALKSISKHESEGFDLCDGVHCQVYGGLSGEDERSNEAVNATRGVVVLYEGQLASTFFHDSCGGHTENIEDVWGTKAPEYLKGRSVKYANSPRKDFWRNKVSAELIGEKLEQGGFKAGEIEKIKISGRTRSGRAKNLKIYGSQKTIKLSAAKFRSMVDPWLIKSTLFDGISKKGRYFEFSGFGWGHGVGLCQQSARNMAQKGIAYEKILVYFYPGTYLAKWDEQGK